MADAEVRTAMQYPLCVIHVDAETGEDAQKVEAVLSVSVWEGVLRLHTSTEQINLPGRRISYIHGTGAEQVTY